MNENHSAKVEQGVTFLEMLFLLFLGLKLAGKISWSWWWVFAPLWLPIAIVVLVVGIAAIVAVVSYARKKDD